MRTYQKALGLGFILVITGSPISCGNDAPKPGTTCLKDGEQPVEGQCYDANGCPCQHGTGNSGTGASSGNGGTTSGSGGTGATSGSGGSGTGGAGNGGSTTGGSGGTGASSGSGGAGGGNLGDNCAYDNDCASHSCCGGHCVDKNNNENHCGACEHDCNGGTCNTGVCNGGSGGSSGTGGSSTGGSGNGGSGNGGSTTGGSGGTGASSGSGGAGGGNLGDNCAYDNDCASHSCCGGHCVDKNNNENHCGACSHDCNGGTCISGVCNGGSGGGGTGGSSGTGGSGTGGTGGSGTGGSSGSGGSNGGPGDPCLNDNECVGLSCCGNICTSKNTDEQNCGTCGHKCSSEGPNLVCQAGQCLPCVDPSINCTTFCADFSANISCGGCNIVCTGGQTCQPAPAPVFHACQ
jgi:hypothetical protein